MQNYFSNMAGGGQTSDGNPSVETGAPWWMRFLGRGAGIAGGLGKKCEKISNNGKLCHCYS
jgi:hypothetical protein